jgi:hypothetical protein
MVYVIHVCWQLAGKLSANLFLDWNSTCFGQFLCPSWGVFHCTHSNGICHTGLLTAWEQAVSKPVWHKPLLCVQWKTPHDGQRNCPKHVEFQSKNKFEKLVHLVGFIIRKCGKSSTSRHRVWHIPYQQTQCVQSPLPTAVMCDKNIYNPNWIHIHNLRSPKTFLHSLKSKSRHLSKK